MDVKTVQIGAAVRYGWESLKKDFWYFITLLLLVTIITAIPNRLGNSFIFSLLSLVVSAWLTGGLYHILLEYHAGRKPEITALFTQTKHFVNILGGTILVGLIVIGGLILLIVPGIYWALKYSFTIYLIVDKDMGIMEALHASGEMTMGIKGQLFLFGLTAAGIMILGAICLGVGVFVAMPIVSLAFMWVYRNLPAPAAVIPAKA